jgi:putative PIN family toxin of toxin-antitoxin system
VRIVLDTNVALSALLWGGPPRRVLEAARAQPGVQLYTSPALLEELADVLTRPSPTKRLALIGKTARDVLADYAAAMEVVTPEAVPRVVRDPDDDQVIAAAVAAQADVIVSGDADLLDLREYQGIAIVTAADAAQRLAAASAR